MIENPNLAWKTRAGRRKVDKGHLLERWRPTADYMIKLWCWSLQHNSKWKRSSPRSCTLALHWWSSAFSARFPLHSSPSHMHPSSPHKLSERWLQAGILQLELQEILLPSGNSSIAWLQGGAMPVQVISSQEKKFTLQRAPHSPQIHYTFLSQINQSSSAQTRERSSPTVGWERGSRLAKNLPFAGSKTASECCLENVVSDTF